VVREVPRPSPWFEGCNIFFRRAALEQTGGFDESFGRFPCGEDTNLGWSVLDAGWERGWADEAVVEHELGERPWSWHLRFHWMEGNLVHLAARHPDIRHMFWRPWAVKRENALFAAAVAGALASLRFKPAALGVVPYLVWLSPGRKVGLTGGALQVSAHAASLAGKAVVGVRERQFLL
jgi:GT2 family glycosyltransferase